MKNKQNQGITLIALIITIIVMLILVVVTVTTAVNKGLISKARSAATETEKNSILEQIIGMAEYTNDGYIDVEQTYSKVKTAFGADKIGSIGEDGVFTVEGTYGTYEIQLTTERISLNKTIQDADNTTFYSLLNLPMEMPANSFILKMGDGTSTPTLIRRVEKYGGEFEEVETPIEIDKNNQVIKIDMTGEYGTETYELPYTYKEVKNSQGKIVNKLMILDMSEIYGDFYFVLTSNGLTGGEKVESEEIYIGTTDDEYGSDPEEKDTIILKPDGTFECPMFPADLSNYEEDNELNYIILKDNTTTTLIMDGIGLVELTTESTDKKIIKNLNIFGDTFTYKKIIPLEQPAKPFTIQDIIDNSDVTYDGAGILVFKMSEENFKKLTGLDPSAEDFIENYIFSNEALGDGDAANLLLARSAQGWSTVSTGFSVAIIAWALDDDLHLYEDDMLRYIGANEDDFEDAGDVDFYINCALSDEDNSIEFSFTTDAWGMDTYYIRDITNITDDMRETEIQILRSKEINEMLIEMLL